MDDQLIYLLFAIPIPPVRVSNILSNAKTKIFFKICHSTYLFWDAHGKYLDILLKGQKLQFLSLPSACGQAKLQETYFGVHFLCSDLPNYCFSYSVSFNEFFGRIFLTNFWRTYIWPIFFDQFFDDFFWRIFWWIFFDEYFDKHFLTNFLTNLFTNFCQIF